MNPGDTLPTHLPPLHARTLNEGRGVNPGDTLNVGVKVLGSAARSTKAGA